MCSTSVLSTGGIASTPFTAATADRWAAFCSAERLRPENPVSPGAGNNGYGGADFYLGLPNAYGAGLTCCVWGHRSSTIAGYVQDDWRVTNNLTLNLGVRYETFTPWVGEE